MRMAFIEECLSLVNKLSWFYGLNNRQSMSQYAGGSSIDYIPQFTGN